MQETVKPEAWSMQWSFAPQQREPQRTGLGFWDVADVLRPRAALTIRHQPAYQQDSPSYWNLKITGSTSEVDSCSLLTKLLCSIKQQTGRFRSKNQKYIHICPNTHLNWSQPNPTSGSVGHKHIITGACFGSFMQCCVNQMGTSLNGLNCVTIEIRHFCKRN